MFDEREPAEPELTPDLKAIEGKLSRLVPAGARVDRDRMMYEAGRAAERATYEPSASPSLRRRGNVWVWRGVSAFMTAASLLLGTMLVWQQQALEVAQREQTQRPVPQQIVSEQQPANSASPAAPTAPDIRMANWIALQQPGNGYLGIRYTALTRGVDAIESDDMLRGSREPAREVERTQRDMMQDFLPSAKHDSHSRS
jgi:hypothetical protein